MKTIGRCRCSAVSRACADRSIPSAPLRTGRSPRYMVITVSRSYLLVIGEAAALVWVLAEQRMAFPSLRRSQAAILAVWRPVARLHDARPLPQPHTRCWPDHGIGHGEDERCSPALTREAVTTCMPTCGTPRTSSRRRDGRWTSTCPSRSYCWPSCTSFRMRTARPESWPHWPGR
jgi:hypothetical protein